MKLGDFSPGSDAGSQRALCSTFEDGKDVSPSLGRSGMLGHFGIPKFSTHPSISPLFAGSGPAPLDFDDLPEWD